MLTCLASREPAGIEFTLSTSMPAVLQEVHAARPISASGRTEIAPQSGSQARRGVAGASPSGSRSTRATRGSVHYEVR
jgi:hypothetical protein